MKCQHEVRVNGLNFLRVRQCKREAVAEHSGKWFCKTHDPIQQVIRQEKREVLKIEKNKNLLSLYHAQLVAKFKRKNGKL